MAGHGVVIPALSRMEATAYSTTYVMYLRGKRFSESSGSRRDQQRPSRAEKTSALAVSNSYPVVLVGRCVCTRRQTSPVTRSRKPWWAASCKSTDEVWGRPHRARQLWQPRTDCSIGGLSPCSSILAPAPHSDTAQTRYRCAQSGFSHCEGTRGRRGGGATIIVQENEC